MIKKFNKSSAEIMIGAVHMVVFNSVSVEHLVLKYWSQIHQKVSLGVCVRMG